MSSELFADMGTSLAGSAALTAVLRAPAL